MDKEILANIYQNSSAQPGDTLIVAVSGGADSVYLLHQLGKLPFQLVVAHFNHKLRPSSDEESAFVRDLAASLNLPFVYGQGDVSAFSQETKKSIEESARILRYSFLVNAALENHSNFITTAHQANDQVETVLMHLFRGSGLSGLAGMHYCTILSEFHPTISILRPLLSIWRTDIEQFLEEKGIQYCVDESNEDKKYFRNNIRHEVLPYLLTLYPALQNNLWNTSEVLRADLEIIQQIVDQKWEQIAISIFSQAVCLNKSLFRMENIGIQRNLLRKAFFLLSPASRDVSFASIERVRLAINCKYSGTYDLESNIAVNLFGDKAVMAQRNYDWMSHFFPQLIAEGTMVIYEIGEYQLSSEWRLTVQVLNAEEVSAPRKTATALIAALDFEEMQAFPITIQHPQAAEKFQPLGMATGHIKLGQFFINQKIPQSARKNYPVVKTKFNEIAWLAGLRLAHPFRVTERTQKIIILELKHQE